MKKLITLIIVVLVLWKISTTLAVKYTINDAMERITKEEMIIEGVKDTAGYESYKKGREALWKYRKLKRGLSGKEYRSGEGYFYTEEERGRLLKEARVHFEKAVEREPNHAEYHNVFADVLEDLKEYDLALKEYERAFELDGNKLDYLFYVSSIYREMGRKAEADIHLNKYIEIAKECTDSQHIDYIIGLFIGTNRFNEAKIQIERARKLPSYKIKDELDFYEKLINKKEQLNKEK